MKDSTFPPFEKGGQGGFLEGLWSKARYWLLAAALPIRALLLISDSSRTF
jgi:hypothetical protein